MIVYYISVALPFCENPVCPDPVLDAGEKADRAADGWPLGRYNDNINIHNKFDNANVIS